MKQFSGLLIVMMLSSVCFADTIYVKNTLLIPDSLQIKYKDIEDQKSIFSENLPSIITGLISLCAIGFTFAATYITLQNAKENLKDQLKVQLAITIQKEWITDVRKYTTTVCYHSVYIAESNLEAYQENMHANLMQNRRNEYFSSGISLRLLLDKKKQLENDLLIALAELAEAVTEAQILSDIDTIEETHIPNVYEVAHLLFDSMK